MRRYVLLACLAVALFAAIASDAMASGTKVYVESVLADSPWQPTLERLVYDEARKAGFEIAASPDQADYRLRAALLSRQNTREWNWFAILVLFWLWPFVGWTQDWVTVSVDMTLVDQAGEPAFSQLFTGKAQESIWFSDFRGPEYKTGEALAEAVQIGARSLRNLAMH